MKFHIDGIAHRIDDAQMAGLLINAYEKMKIKYPALAKGGLVRIALKQIMTPFVIPALHQAFKSVGDELPRPEKHADLFDFAVHQLAYFVEKHGPKLELEVHAQPNVDGGKNIVGISPRAGADHPAAVAGATDASSRTN